ncbi:filamentous hemagglutinin N-terminal domain-containing protein, partial [Acinetobacter sp. WCHA29]|uniref:two-partner secretion domain-containing protein n=1 Tax=Acinetobacter sp. WCHA29 TaxID=2004649 RepID=UPI00148E56FC
MKLNYLTVEIRALLAASLIVPNFAFALPQGGNVVAGQADIKNVNSTYMTIDQKSNRAVVNWDSFNVGKNDWVDIRQQKSSDALLNRVTGNNLSEIAGKITAKGQVFIVNPNGIIFKNGSIVNVGSLVASTADIENAAFMQGGKLEFNKKSNKKDAAITIENGAYIDVGQLEQNGQKIDNPNGFAAFIAPQIKQGGFITAQLGTIHLAAGEAFTLDVGGGLLNILLGDSDLQTLGIENTGTILSKGGLIRLQAASINNLLQGFITQNGQLIASEFTQDAQGNIQLTAPKGQVLLNASEIKTGSSAIVAEKSQLAANKIVLGDGVIYSTELAELKAKQDIQQSANQQIAATKQLSIASEQGNISLAGAIEAGQADIQAKQGKITTVKAENKGISSTTGDVTVTAKDADLNAFISAKNNLSVNTTNTLNIDAEAKAQKISLDSASTLVQGKNSKLLAESTKDTALNIVGKTGVTLNGVSESKANTTIQSTAGSVVFSKDSQGLSSVGDLSITANQAELVAQLLSTGKNLSVTTTQDLTVSGKAKAQGMSLKSTQGSIKQSSTSVLDATNLTISSDTKDIELQGTSKVATDATLTAKGNITVSAVSKDQGIAVGNNLTVKGQNVVIGGDKSAPTVKAANLVEVKDTTNLTLNDGVIEAKQIKLSAGNIQQELNQGIKA